MSDAEKTGQWDGVKFQVIIGCVMVFYINQCHSERLCRACTNVNDNIELVYIYILKVTLLY